MDRLNRPRQGGLFFFLASLTTAVLLFLGMPGHTGWWPLLFFALVPLLAFVLQATPRQSFLAGLFGGLIYHASMLYWIVIVLGRHGGLPPFIAIPAMLLLSLYMAIYPALFCMLVSWFGGNKKFGVLPPAMLFFIPSLWVGLDWLRGILFTGFPWMDLGYGLASQPILIQSAELGGHHLITFLVVMANVFIVRLPRWRRKGISITTGSDRLVAFLAAAVLIFSCGYSVFRYDQLSDSSTPGTHMKVAVIQGNINQLEKWQPGHKQLTVDRYLKLSESEVAGTGTSLIVWPETAVPFFPAREPLFGSVQRWTDDYNVWLLTGAPHFELEGDLRQSGRVPIRYYNSAQLVDPSGAVSGRYEKQHLVPFGEYVPLRKFLFFLEPLVESAGNFSKGRSPAPLVMGEHKLGVLICYESIFPEMARKKVLAGADVLVNITNDAWYGRSSAPYQSFSMAVLRAVETRRSLVRAANTGISGFVDPAGRTMEATPIFETLSLSAAVPVMHGETVFTRFGFMFGPACLIFSVLIMLFSRKKK